MKNKKIKLNDIFLKKKYPMPSWAVRQFVRASGLVEDICEHGCGHPNELWLQKNDPQGKKMLAIHGCDGCCSKSIRDIREGKINLRSAEFNEVLQA